MIKGLHHIGVASKNIEKDVAFFATLGYTPKGEARDDVPTGIRVQFLEAQGQPSLELVQNLDENGPVTAHIQAKRKIFHFAYECTNLETDAATMIEQNKGMFLVPITEADSSTPEIKAWCYLAFRNSMIVELVQLKENN